MKLTNEQAAHYSLFAAVLLVVGAASIAYNFATTAQGYRPAGLVLLFASIATLLFVRFLRMTSKK